MDRVGYIEIETVESWMVELKQKLADLQRGMALLGKEVNVLVV